MLRAGALVEVWEVDDTRAPRTASFLMSGRLDFVARTGDYLPMTFWRVHESDGPDLNCEMALEAARRGLFVVAEGGTR